MSYKRERSRSRSSDRESYDQPMRSNMKLSRVSDSRSSSFGSRKVYVSNITFDCSLQELRDKFNEVGDVTHVQMLKDDKDKRFKGCAIVSFKEPSMAFFAIDQLNRSEFKGRKLVIKQEDSASKKSLSDRKRPKNEFDSRPPPAPSYPAQQQNYNMYGLSMTFLESLKIDLPLVETVFVANLDYDIDEKQLKDVFSLAGNVIDCEIFRSKEGKSRGFGIVEYEHPVEAVQSISMLHNQSYKDRSLTVRMDRSDRKKDLKPKLPTGLKSVGFGLGIDGAALRDIKVLPGTNQVGAAAIPPVSNVGLNAVGSLGLGAQVNQAPGLMEALPMANRMAAGISPGLSMAGAGNNIGVGLNMPSNRDFGSNSGYQPGTLGNIIQLTNLPMDYSSENLRKLCWPYGDVRLAEMRTPGAGMVKYRSEADGRRAVDMLDRQHLEGRMLNVRLL